MSALRTFLSHMLRRYLAEPKLPQVRVLKSAGLALEVTNEDGSRIIHNFDVKHVSVQLDQDRLTVWKNGRNRHAVDDPNRTASHGPMAGAVHFQPGGAQQALDLYRDVQKALRGPAAGWRPAAIGALVGLAVIFAASPRAGRDGVMPQAAAAMPPVAISPSSPALAVPTSTPARAIVSSEEAKMVAALQGVKLPGASGPTYYVFSDPNCPFCKELEASVESVSGYQPVVLPLGYKPGSRDLAAAVMCSADPGQEWKRAMAGKSTATPCDKGYQAVDANMRAFEKLGLNSTPTMLTPKGVLVTGAATPDELKGVLQQ